MESLLTWIISLEWGTSMQYFSVAESLRGTFFSYHCQVKLVSCMTVYRIVTSELPVEPKINNTDYDKYAETPTKANDNSYNPYNLSAHPQWLKRHVDKSLCHHKNARFYWLSGWHKSFSSESFSILYIRNTIVNFRNVVSLLKLIFETKWILLQHIWWQTRYDTS